MATNEHRWRLAEVTQIDNCLQQPRSLSCWACCLPRSLSVLCPAIPSVRFLPPETSPTLLLPRATETDEPAHRRRFVNFPPLWTTLQSSGARSVSPCSAGPSRRLARMNLRLCSLPCHSTSHEPLPSLHANGRARMGNRSVQRSSLVCQHAPIVTFCHPHLLSPSSRRLLDHRFTIPTL